MLRREVLPPREVEPRRTPLEEIADRHADIVCGAVVLGAIAVLASFGSWWFGA